MQKEHVPIKVHTLLSYVNRLLRSGVTGTRCSLRLGEAHVSIKLLEARSAEDVANRVAKVIVLRSLSGHAVSQLRLGGPSLLLNLGNGCLRHNLNDVLSILTLAIVRDVNHAAVDGLRVALLEGNLAGLRVRLNLGQVLRVVELQNLLVGLLACLLYTSDAADE